MMLDLRTYAARFLFFAARFSMILSLSWQQPRLTRLLDLYVMSLMLSLIIVSPNIWLCLHVRLFLLLSMREFSMVRAAALPAGMRLEMLFVHDFLRAPAFSFLEGWRPPPVWEREL